MMTLDEISPNEMEREAIAGMPEQVAIGYIRASRRAMGGRRLFDPSHKPDLGSLFNIFGGQQ
jgi:hypothetical protein